MYILDSDIFLKYLAGDDNVVKNFLFRRKNCFISSVSLAQIYRKLSITKRLNEVENINVLISEIGGIIDFDEISANRFGKIWEQVISDPKAISKTPSIISSMISATALAKGYALATTNRNYINYKSVKGLSYQNWSLSHQYYLKANFENKIGAFNNFCQKLSSLNISIEEATNICNESSTCIVGFDLPNGRSIEEVIHYLNNNSNGYHLDVDYYKNDEKSANYVNRLTSEGWNEPLHGDVKFLMFERIDRVGILADITKVLKAESSNILRVKSFTSFRESEDIKVSRMCFYIENSSKSSCSRIIEKIKSIDDQIIYLPFY